MNKQLKYTMALLCGILLLASCHGEEEYSGQESAGNRLSLQCVPTAIGSFGGKTRAAGGQGDVMTSDEKKITSIDIFLFDSDGNYLQNTEESSIAFQGYRHADDNSNWVLNNDVFADQTKARNATVYVLANLEAGTLVQESSDGIPSLRTADGKYEKVTDKSVLDNYIYIPRLLPEDGGIPAAGLPMYAIVNEDLSYTEGKGMLIQIPLKSLMARVDVSMKLVVPNIEDVSEDGRYPNYVSQSFNVMNIPAGTRFSEPTESETQGIKVTNLEIDWVNAAIVHNGTGISKRFYMFEHYRQPNEVDPSTVYPAHIEEAHKQRYKPKFAKEDAVYVNICGMFTNKNAYAYDVDYKLYLGADATYNYVVQRNLQYKNNITIHGITSTNDPENEETVTLDTRVNISETAPYYISMLRERNHDAHFCVTPMDIYVLSQKGYVTVELENPDKNNWLRMDYVGHVDSYGEGKKKQFTTTLMNELTTSDTHGKGGVGPYEIHDNGVVDPEHPDELGYGERIYLYLDENLDVDAQQNGIDREANLIIKYYDGVNPTPVSSRNLLIRQKGLWKLTVKGDWGGAPEKTLWAEVYEEYADHYDPKDDYDVTYNGLEWGAKGVDVDIDGSKTETFMNGFDNTRKIIDTYHKDENNFTLNDIPGTAAEYCYNKNIRQPDGSVPIIKWYLPGITEMEAIVKQYATVEQHFQDDFYWSSSVDYKKGNWWNSVGGDFNYARSTKARRVSGEWTHTESEPDGTAQQMAGRQLRDTKLRIRAVRRDLNPY